MNKDILALTDLDLVLKLWNKEKDPKFEGILTSNSLTKEQLNKMGEQFPRMKRLKRFQCLLMEKSMPIPISFYLGQFKGRGSFQNFVPRALGMQCYDVLLDLVMDSNVDWTLSMRSVVLLNWMRFRMDHFVCDFDAVFWLKFGSFCCCLVFAEREWVRFDGVFGVFTYSERGEI